MKTKHPEITIEQLKAECALALPLLNGAAQSTAPAANVAPQPAIRADFTAVPPVELTQAQIHGLRVALGHIPAAEAMMPTNAAPTVTKTATIPQMSAGNSAYIEAQRRKFGNFRAR